MDTEVAGQEEMLERQPSDAIKVKTALPCDGVDVEEPVVNGDSNGLHSPTSSESNQSQPQSDNHDGNGNSDKGTSDINHENDTNNETEQNSLNNHTECSSDAPECDGKKLDSESLKGDIGSEASKDSNAEGELCESSKAGDIGAGEEPSLTNDKDRPESKSEAKRDEHEQMDVDESDNGKPETPLEGSDKVDQAEKTDQTEKKPAQNVNGLDGEGHSEDKQEKVNQTDSVTADGSDAAVIDTRGCDSPTELMDVSEKADSTDSAEDNDVIMVDDSPVKGLKGKPVADKTVKVSTADKDGKADAVVILDDGKNKISAKVGDLETVTSETVSGQAAKGASIKFTTTNKVVTSAAGSAPGAVTKDGTPISQATSILKIKNSPKIEGLRESLLKQTTTSRSVSAPAVPDFAKEMRPVAAILSQIGMNLVREHVYSDLIKVQSRKLGQNKLNAMAVKQLGMLKTAAQKLSDENKKYKLKMHLCGYCGYKCDGENVMALHLEFPHIDGNDLKCAKCDFVTRAKQQFTFHMDVEHFSQAKYVSPFHLWQCKFCKFEVDQVKTFNRHIIKCAKAFNLKRNLEPSATDCDIPLKKSKAMMRQAAKSQVASPATVRSVLNNSPATKPATSSSIVLAIPTSSSATRVNAAAVTKTTKVATSYAVPQPVAVQKPTTGRVPTKFTTVRQALAGAQGTTSTSVRMPVQVQGQRQPVVINYPIQPQVSGALPGNAMFTVVNQAGQLYLQPTQIAAMAGIQISPPAAVVQSVAQPVVQQSAAVVQTVRPASVTVTQSSKSKGKAATVASAAAPHFEVCEICGGFVKDIPSLRIHFYWKHGIDIPQGADTPAFTCFLCYNPKAFWTARGLQQHREKEHGVTGHGTIQQTSAKQTAAKSQVHVLKQQPPPQPVKKLEPGGKVHSCYLCGVSSEKILDHLYFAHRVSLSTMTKMRKCLICGLELATDEAFSFHLNSYHKLAAQIASQKYATSPAVRPIAPAVKAPQGQHKCYRCNKAWQTREDLQLHFAQVHRCEKEECQICHENINIGRPFIRHMSREHLKELKVNVKRMSKEQLEKYSVDLNDSVSDKKPVEKEPVVKPADKASGKDATPKAFQDQDKGTKFKEILQVDGEEIILEVAESDDEK